MSWDVILFNYRGSPPGNFGELPDDHRPEPLGQASEVRDAISRHL
jgi:hypothetical protein